MNEWKIKYHVILELFYQSHIKWTNEAKMLEVLCLIRIIKLSLQQKSPIFRLLHILCLFVSEIYCWCFFSQINFILFISIIRILVQKLRSSDVGGNERSQYRFVPTAAWTDLLNQQGWVLNPSIDVVLVILRLFLRLFWCLRPVGVWLSPPCCWSLCSALTTWCSCTWWFRQTQSWTTSRSSSTSASDPSR